MEELFWGLPAETWGMIAIIWVIVLVNVIMMRRKIKKTELEERLLEENRDE